MGYLALRFAKTNEATAEVFLGSFLGQSSNPTFSDWVAFDLPTMPD
jgi:hypothetical protein